MTRDVPTTPSTPTPPHDPPSPPPPASPMDRAFLVGIEGVTHLALVRHGQQDYGDRTRPSEWVDPPLSPTGVRQAAAVGAALAAERVDVVYTSTLERARDTAEAIAGAHGLEPVVVPELREVEIFRDLPDGTRVTDHVPPLLLAGIRERFVRELTWDVYPFSETSDELRHRVVSTIEGILATHPGEHVVVACHGGVINAYLAHILGIGTDMFFRPAHASVSRVRALGDRRVVASLNETHHLAAVDPALVTV